MFRNDSSGIGNRSFSCFIGLPGKMMKSWRCLVNAFALSVVFVFSVSLAPPALAQDTGAGTSVVQDYVARTREIPTADYRVDRQPDDDNFQIYRVTIGPEVAGIAAGERVFDIAVTKDGAEVVGEHAVKPAD
jgi:hypothetical protein